MMPIETRKINNAHKNKDDFTYINKGKQPNRKSKRKRYWSITSTIRYPVGVSGPKKYMYS